MVIMETRTDAELLDDYVSRGDDAAFAGIVARYGAFVHRTCLRLLRDEHEAEDACQAVFLVLARKARRLRKGDLSAWLYRVGHLVAAETVRKRMRRTQREEEYAADDVPAEASGAGETESVGKETARREEERNRIPPEWIKKMELSILQSPLETFMRADGSTVVPVKMRKDAGISNNGPQDREV